MKRTRIFTVLCAAALVFIATSCGTSDYVESLTLSSPGTSVGGFYNLAGVDGTLQLVVLANYHSGKTIDVTNNVTWAATPVGCAETVADDTEASYLCPGGSLPPYGPNTVPISKTGLMTAIVGMCTWTDATNTTVTPEVPYSPAVWLYTGYYQVTATYKNFTSQPVGIGVGVTASNNFAGCGPT